MSVLNEKIKCHVCGDHTHTITDFVWKHLEPCHQLSAKDYFDKYLNVDGDGSCELCGQPTQFVSIAKGYQPHCKYHKKNIHGLRISESRKAIDLTEATQKAIETKIERYGEGQKSVVAKRVKTNMDRYGTSTTLLNQNVKEAREKALQNPEVNERRKAWWTEERKQQVAEKRKATMLAKHGVEYTSQIRSTKEKVLVSRLGKFGLDVSNENLYEIMGRIAQYRRRCAWLTKKLRSSVMESWDGLDFYLGDDIRDIDSHADRPTIDHKKSVVQCFAEGMSPEECCVMENLCVTRHRVNAKKNYRGGEKFYEWIEEEKRRLNI